MIFESIFLLAPGCLMDLLWLLGMSLIPALLAWLAGSSYFGKWKDEAERLEGELETSNSMVSRLNGELSTLNSNLSAANSEISTKESMISSLNMAISGWETKQTEWDTERTGFQSTISSKDSEISSWSTKFGTLEKEKTSLSAQLKTKEDELSSWSVKYGNLEKEKTTLSSNLKAKEADINSWTMKFNDAQKEKEELGNSWNIKFGNWESEKAEMQKSIEAKEADINNWSIKFGDFENKYNGLVKEHEASKTEIHNWSIKFNTAQKEKEELANSWNIKFGNSEKEKTQLTQAVAEKEKEASNWSIKFGDWQTKYAALEKEHETSKTEIHNWSIKFNNYQKEAEEKVVAASKSTGDKYLIMIGDWEKKYNTLQKEHEASKTEINNWSIKFGNWEKEKAELTQKVADKNREATSWSIKFNTVQKEKEQAIQSAKGDGDKYLIMIGDWEKKYNALQKDYQASKTEINNWSIKFGNFQKESEAKVAAASKSTGDKYLIMIGDWEKKYNALQKDYQASKTEINNWSIKFGNFQKESEAKVAAASKSAGDKYLIMIGDWEKKYNALQKDLEKAKGDINNWSIKFTNLQGEGDNYKAQLDAKEGEIHNWYIRFTALEESYKGLEAKFGAASEWESRYGTLKADYDALLLQIADYEARLGKASMFNCLGKKWKQNDLKIVEGIGPKIEQLLYAAGIDTWKKLSVAKKPVLKGILEAAGPRFQMHDPSSWARQASYCVKGDCSKLTTLQEELDGGRKATPKAAPAKPAPPKKFDCMGKKWNWDDLKIIEGIGPKIEGLLNADGITTWDQLAKSKASRLKEILIAGGSRFQMHDPTSWPKQAALASKGNCEKLAKLQDELDGGRKASSKPKAETPEERAARAKVVGDATKKIFGKRWKLDDHTVVEGIGPKIDGLLRAAGIKTWRQLSETKVERIQEILDAAGPRYKLAVPGTWPQQAALAADAKWAELKKLQDELDGGRA